MKPIALLTTFSLTVSTVWASGQVLAKEVPALYPRTSFQGGWPIEASTCPSNTTSCADLGSCCPSNTFCYTAGLGGVAACCPTSKCLVKFRGKLPTLNDSTATFVCDGVNQRLPFFLQPMTAPKRLSPYLSAQMRPGLSTLATTISSAAPLGKSASCPISQQLPALDCV